MHISKRWYSPNRWKREVVEVSYFLSCTYLPIQEEPIHLHISQDAGDRSIGKIGITLSKADAKKLGELLIEYVNELEVKGQ